LKAINANILDEQRFLQENSVSETGIKVQLNYILSPRLSFENGYNFIETKVTNLDDIDTPLYRSLISEVVRNHSIYSQLNYKSVSGNTFLSTGIRTNYLDKFSKFIVEPRLSFNQRFLSFFNIELLGEFKHQITSHIINSQSDFLGLEKRRWQLSNNKDIPVMKSKQISIALSYSKNGWLLNGEGYIKEVNGITSQSQGFQNQFEFVKTSGSYNVVGGDLLIRKSINTASFWMSYSLMDNKYSFNTLSEEKFPSNFDIKHAITLGSSYSKNGLSIATGFNWHSGKPITSPVVDNEIIDNAINYNNTNNERLEEYLRVDLSASYHLDINKNTSIEAGFSLWNVLNQRNLINKYYKINDDNDEKTVKEINQYSLGLTPNANVRVIF
jgi:hypothetical protein